MQVIRTIESFRQAVSEKAGELHGFVPTMGALHEGHLSLVRTAKAECGIVSVSIFVNPTQFNDREDLKNYPRTEGKDLDLLSGVLGNSDIVFIPAVSEIYPEEDKRIFSFGRLDKVMEGAHRPGHFNGVAQVVSKLFDIARPDIAFFGQKDFQQLAVIRELEKQRGNRIIIRGCPTVREHDGLAMSSRNMLLEPGIRERAPVIFRTLSSAASMKGKMDIPELKNYVTGNIDSEPGFKTEYFEIADELTLEPLASLKDLAAGRSFYGCVAVRAGKIRLIDNLEFQFH